MAQHLPFVTAVVAAGILAAVPVNASRQFNLSAPDEALRGTEWEGEGLDGRTTNGPLTVSVPSGYASGVVVEADGRSPFTCKVCSDAQRTWNDEGRRVQLGSGPERVRLQTTNGPVTVKN